MPLPSSQELQDAANAEHPSQRCAELVLQTVTYGTEAHEALQTRTQEACKVLADAWEDCVALESSLVDALWLRGCILSSMKSDGKDGESSKEPLDALVELIKILVQIPDRQSFWTKLQANLMPSLIDASGLASEQDILKRLKMHNTQVHYKQQKYNLLQEESEGYAKVLSFMISGESKDDGERLHVLRKLLGEFELDPNRVLDLAIDILASKLFPDTVVDAEKISKPSRSAYVSWLLGLIKDLSVDKLPPLLGFKLSAAEGPALGLLQTVAFLASENLLRLDEMVRYLAPVENDIEEAHKIWWMRERRRIQGLSRVSLSGATKEDPKLAELQDRLEKCLTPLKEGQFLNLLLILLKWGELNLIRPTLSAELWGYLCNMFPTNFGSAMCEIAGRRLEPYYQSLVGTPALSGSSLPEEDRASPDDFQIDDIVEEISEPLLYTVQAGCIAVHPVLFCKLCRVFRSLLSDQESEGAVSEDTYNFFKKFVVPSLSLFPSNPAISTELWSALKRLPYATRYRLYEDWRGPGLEREGLSSSTSGKPLPVVEKEVEAGKAARYALKRLSKDNMRDMGRQLAKVTHSCPLVVYATILNQIESYDNMVEVMVEAQRFTSLLGLDVLGFCILSRLSGTSGGVNRSRLKEDGVNVSQWLQSLESFSGAFYKRCPYVEFRGILAYLMRRLREGNVMELGVLRTILKVPGGYSFADYSPAASLSTAQLEGRAGSMTLKRETMSFGIVEETNARASERIRHVLQMDGYGATMLILIAQARSRILFESSKGQKKPVKLVGNLYDTCQVVMSILLEFLTAEDVATEKDRKVGGSIEKYAKNLPMLTELDKDFGFDVESTWMLCRPLVWTATHNAADNEQRAEVKKFALSDAFRENYESMLPDKVWSVVSPALFESFFMSYLYDLICPENSYATEIHRISKEIERLERAKAGGQTSLQGPTPSRSEGEELERLKNVAAKLTSDQKKQSSHVDEVLKGMETKKEKFFKSSVVSKESARAFLMHCVFRRSLQSPDDAMYCACFALRLHKLETPGFSTLHYIDELIAVVAGSLFGLTEGEGANLSILLWETWKVVNKWRYEEDSFAAEVEGKPGSFMEAIADGDEVQAVSHKLFVDLYNSWHASLGAALMGCLASKEYMHIRTGLLVLTRIVEVFPTRPRLGNKLLATLEPLQDETTSRQDIRASAVAYGTMLLKARDEGKWVEEDAAVANARAEKEKAAAEERKKKLEEQFQALQRDSDKITQEIGPRDRFDRRRDTRDGRDYGGARAAAPSGADRSRNGHPPSSRENGEVTGRESREHKDRRSPPRESERRRDRPRDRVEDRGHNRKEPVGSTSTKVSERHAPESRRRDGERDKSDEPRSLSGRWARNETGASTEGSRASRTAKRSRPPSPEVGGESRGSSKRPRVEDESGSRREERGASPPRSRGRNAPESSTGRSSRSRRSRR